MAGTLPKIAIEIGEEPFAHDGSDNTTRHFVRVTLLRDRQDGGNIELFTDRDFTLVAANERAAHLQRALRESIFVRPLNER